MFEIQEVIDGFNAADLTITVDSTFSLHVRSKNDPSEWRVAVYAEESEFNNPSGNSVHALIVEVYPAEDAEAVSMQEVLRERPLFLRLIDDKDEVVGLTPFTMMGSTTQLLAYPRGTVLRLEIL